MNRSGHTARNNLPQRTRRETPRPFTPTVSVERPVIWENETDKTAYRHGMERAMGKGRKRNQQPRQRIVPPEQLRVVQLRHAVLGEMSRDRFRYDQRQPAMERLAGLLQERLYELLKSAPEKLVLDLGRLACVSEPVVGPSKIRTEKDIVAVEPAGWRGFGARYPARNNAGQVTTVRQLALEGALYKEAIADTNQYLEADDMGDIVANPYVTLLEAQRNMTIPGADFSGIEDRLSGFEAFPERLILGDPIVTLTTGPLPGEIEILPIREFDDYLLRAAA